MRFIKIKITPKVSKLNALYVPKTLIFTLFFLILSIGVSAQETENKAGKAALGIGAEWNMNSRENFAGGAILNFDFDIAPSLALGIVATASTNFYGITVIEPAAFFRWYFLSRENSGWFAQADLGAYLVLEDEDFTPMFLGGLRAGIRLPLGERFFIEPFGRFGYPFAFGAGALAGIKF
jgi:hypothetical protein